MSWIFRFTSNHSDQLKQVDTNIKNAAGTAGIT